jgi:septal ring factor EnvC (AmiA/AmiB activator)
MTIEIALLISIVSVAFSVISGIVNMNRNKSADDKHEATELTTILVKLENISNDTTEIKSDIKGVKDDIKHHSEQIIRMDESLKSAWKAISKLQDKVGDTNDGKRS